MVSMTGEEDHVCTAYPLCTHTHTHIPVAVMFRSLNDHVVTRPAHILQHAAVLRTQDDSVFCFVEGHVPRSRVLSLCLHKLLQRFVVDAKCVLEYHPGAVDNNLGDLTAHFEVFCAYQFE